MSTAPLGTGVGLRGRRIAWTPSTGAGTWALGLTALCVLLALVNVGFALLWDVRDSAWGWSVILSGIVGLTAGIAGAATALVAVTRREHWWLMLAPLVAGAVCVAGILAETL